MVAELLNEEYMSANDIMDTILNEDEDNVNKTIDSEYKNMKDEKAKKADRSKDIKEKLKTADKNKIAEAMAMAKGDIKENIKKSGFATKTKKILRMVIHIGIQVGWFLCPFGLITKLVGHLVIYSIHSAKEERIKIEEENYFKDQIKYYKELEEKTDDPVKRRNIVKVRREFEKANNTIADDIRQREAGKKKNNDDSSY